MQNFLKDGLHPKILVHPWAWVGWPKSKCSPCSKGGSAWTVEAHTFQNPYSKNQTLLAISDINRTPKFRQDWTHLSINCKVIKAINTRAKHERQSSQQAFTNLGLLLYIYHINLLLPNGRKHSEISLHASQTTMAPSDTSVSALKLCPILKTLQHSQDQFLSAL